MCTTCTTELEWLVKFPPGASCVYLVRGGELMKIGFTTNLAKRLSSLRTMSPIPLTLEWVRTGDRQLELAFHRHWKKRRHHGEWFLFPPSSKDPVQTFATLHPVLIGVRPRALPSTPRATRVITTEVSLP